MPSKSSVHKILLFSLLFFFFHSVPFSIISFSAKDSVHQFSLWIYLYSFFLSLMFWLGWILLANTLAKVWRILIGNLMIMIWGMILFGSYHLYNEFGEFFNAMMIRFVVLDPVYLKNYAQTFFTIPFLIGTVLIMSLFNIFWGRYAFKFKNLLKMRALSLFLIVLSMALIGDLGNHQSSKLVSPDTMFAISLVKYKKSKFSNQKLYFSEKPQLKTMPIENKDKPDIFVVVNESWDKIYFANQHGDESMPFLTDLLKRSDAFYFDHAFTASTATDVSMPSVVSGVASFLNNHTLHSVPLMWDIAKQLGYHTIFVSSQRTSWNRQREFFKTKGIDTYIDASDMTAPVINDLGVDDMESSKILTQQLIKVDKNVPIFVFYNTNAMHYPLQNKSDLLNIPNFADRYKKSQYIVDQSIKSIIEVFQQQNRFENLLMFVTSDHGNGRDIHKIGRIANLYDEVINIPFVLKVPQSWMQAKADIIAEIQKNRSKNVSNYDIVPTIFEWFQLQNLAENDKIRKAYMGNSLFSNIAPQRILAITNYNEVKDIEYPSFAVIQENKRFIFQNNQMQVFDVSMDAHQQNVISFEQLEGKDDILKFIESNFLLNQLYHAKR